MTTANGTSRDSARFLNRIQLLLSLLFNTLFQVFAIMLAGGLVYYQKTDLTH
ncbi:hypothetical protein [Paenibacillus donghaensis]|uniref:hypothetical protein n=1 Tax=Paenibacillus donghaensis TaxID=414771 RepID=UPI0012FE5BD1|nr:hypothetical protein [Paenibacillus donghaensis]